MPRVYQLSWDGKLAPFIKHPTVMIFGNEVKINPMHKAIENGHRDVVEFLLRRGFEADCRQGGPKGLEIAAGKGFLDIVKVLLEAGTDITRNSNFGGAHWSAVFYDQEHIAAFLLAELKGLSAAGNGSQRLQQSHCDPKLMLITQGSLISAIRFQNARMVEMLLKEVGPVDLKGDCGETLLLVAVWSTAVEAVRMFLRNGADPNKNSDQWPRALSTAAQRGLVDILEVLLDAGADPNTFDDTGRTPLSHATEEGRVEVVQLLLRYGVNISLQDSDRRWGAFEWAILGKNSEIVNILQPIYEDIGGELAS